MANILDIFRTASGTKLIERSTQITGMDAERLRESYSLIFPSLLLIIRTKGELPENNEKLNEYLKSKDPEETGKKLYAAVGEEIQQLENLSEILGRDRKAIRQLTYLATGVLGSIFSEIKSNEPMLETNELIDTLMGFGIKYEKHFIDSLFHEKGAQLIDDPARTALEDKEDKDEENLLGGYAGGR